MLPTLPQAPTAIAFPLAHPSLLAIASATGSLQFYHIEHRRLLPPSHQLATLNAALRTQFTPIQSMSFEPSRYNPRAARLVIWSHDWLCSVQLDLELIGRLAGKKGNAALRAMDGHLGPEGLFESDTLDSRSLRRKRAREAREALIESVSISGSSDHPSTPAGGSVNGNASSNAAPGVLGALLGRAASSANNREFYKIQADNYRGVCAVDWFGEGEMVLVERPFGDFVGELPQAFWAGSFGKS